MDPFSNLIGLLHPSTAVAKQISGRGRWGVRYAAHDAPGFALVLRGECWLSFETGQPTRLREGDFFLLPTTPPFALSSDPGVEGAVRAPVDAPVRHGDQVGDPDFVALGGTFRIERANAPLLLALLPSFIHISASEGRSGRLNRIIELIAEECAGDRPGREMLLERLLEILLVEALRWRGGDDDGDRAGLLKAMRDPALAPALQAMHADVRGHWTVADLARLAGASRSVFAARFAEALGCGPIEYLARWRMALAKDALISGARSLDRVAEEIGYESASAFSTAFRKRQGVSPGRYARENGTVASL